MSKGWTSPLSVSRGATLSSRVIVKKLSDLPPAVGGVRTLLGYTRYSFEVEELDLGTDGLVAEECVTIEGISAECTRIRTSRAGYLLSAVDNLNAENIRLINDAGPCLHVDGGSDYAEVTANLVAVNFTGHDDVVRFEDAAFCIVDRCAWLDCAASAVGLRGAGSILGLVVTDTASRGNGDGFTLVKVTAADVVASRVRVSDCSITVPNGGVGVSVHADSVGNERLVVHGCNFTLLGSGVPFDEVDPDSIKSFIKDNLGAESTYPRAAYTIANNATGYNATANVPFKLAGTTVARDAQLFTVGTNNRATHTGSKPRRYLLTASATLETAVQNVTVKLLVAVNGTVVEGYEAEGTTQGPSGLRAENLALFAPLELDPTDYVELWGVSAVTTTVTWVSGQVVLAEMGG